MTHERIFDEGECLCPMYENHDGKCGGLECGCHGCQHPDTQMLSTCCDALVLGDTGTDALGFCARCKDGSEFQSVCDDCMEDV